MSLSAIHIHPIPALQDNYIWVVVNLTHRCVLIVDPGEARPVITYLKHHQLTMAGILITHHHWDHVNGIADLLEYDSVPVYGPRLSALSALTDPLADQAQGFLPGLFPNFQVLAVPGHTLDHIAYYADHRLFCGDTLFAGGCGRLFEGTAEQLYTSLQKLAALPDNTQIYCAHEYTLNNLSFALTVEPNNQAIQQRIEQTILLREQGLPTLPSRLVEEKQTNPFLRCHLPEIKQQAEQWLQHGLSSPLAVFTALRAWKNRVA